MKRAAGDPMSKGTEKRVPQMVAELGQALALINCCDMSKLPQEVITAASLISSACTHAKHIMNHENIDPSAGIGYNYANPPRSEEPPAEKRTPPKPETSTSEDLPCDDALRLATAEARSREIQMGL